MDAQAIVDTTRRWIASVVIGLDLCPFARRVFDAGLIRYTATAAADRDALYEALSVELGALVAVSPAEVETAILIHPGVLADFPDYNDFLADADQLLRDRGLRGIVQIAGFHPHYQFAGTEPDALENSTNRSPYPMLHLLREESITRVASDPERLLDIPRRNVESLRRIGRAGLQNLIDEAVLPRPPE